MTAITIPPSASGSTSRWRPLRPADGEAKAALARAAASDTPDRALAQMLLEALWSEGTERTRRLDEATRWLRTHHPEAAKVWAGWKVEGERLVPVR